MSAALLDTNAVSDLMRDHPQVKARLAAHQDAIAASVVVLGEIRYGAFRRSFSLPGHVTGDDVTANYDAGVLSIRVAGAYAGTTPRRIPVNGLTPGVVGAEPTGQDACRRSDNALPLT